jgi:hypothetical protein
MEHLRLSAVAYQIDGMWMVQGIEYDIRARAYTIDEVPKAILRALRERAELDRFLGKAPLEGLAPAPQDFADMFRQAKFKKPLNENGDEIMIAH